MISREKSEAVNQGVIRQYNDEKKKTKKRNNDLQNITQKTNGRATRIALNPGVNSCSVKE